MLFMSKNEGEGMLKFSGSSVIADINTDRDIRVSGSSKLEGLVTCNAFDCSGSLHGAGIINANGLVHVSGSFSIKGDLNGARDGKFSGSTSINGNLTLKGTLISSGTLTVLGNFNCGSDADISGSVKVSGDTIIQGFFIKSGSFKGNSIKAMKGLNISGFNKIVNDLESQKNINVSGRMTIGNNIIGESILLRDYNDLLHRIRKSLRYIYKIGGNIQAKKLVDVSRTYINGDVRGRIVELGRYTKVLGNVYYVDDCYIHKKAELVNPPIKIGPEKL